MNCNIIATHASPTPCQKLFSPHLAETKDNSTGDQTREATLNYCLLDRKNVKFSCFVVHGQTDTIGVRPAGRLQCRAGAVAMTGTSRSSVLKVVCSKSVSSLHSFLLSQCSPAVARLVIVAS